MTTLQIGESVTTAGGRTATRVEPSRYGSSILATNLDRERKRKAREKAAPVLLTAWQRGESLLHSYEVIPMEEYLCYEVIGGKEPYYVCLDESSSAYGCSCPDGIMRGERRPCKHTLGVMVSLWQWAEADGGAEEYHQLFEEIGILALRAGARTPAPEPSPDDRGECGELDVETMSRCDGRRIVHYETFAGQIGYPVWTCQKCGTVVIP